MQRHCLGWIAGSLLLLSSSALAQEAAPEPATAETSTETGTAYDMGTNGAPTAAPAENQPPAPVETTPPAPPEVEPGSIRDRNQHTRPVGISAMAYVPWYYGIGIGVNARFELPIVPDGFIPSINDQISLEPSIAFGYRVRSYAWAGDSLHFLDITPALYATWSFHITPKFRPYAGVGLGYDIGVWLNKNDFGGRDVNGGFFFWDTVVGLFYNFTPNVAFRGELGAQGPKAGLSVLF